MRVLAASLVLLALLVAVPGSESYTASEFRSVPFTGTKDSFWNWDFRSRTDAEEHKADGVDWPMSLLFYGRANVDAVKRFFLIRGYGASFQNLSTMWARLNDGSGTVIDRDKGIANAGCTGGLLFPEKRNHFRIYAPRPPDHMTSGRRTLRNYVLATIHKDIRECAGQTEFGESEDAEGEVAGVAERIWGRRAVDRNYADWRNDEMDHQDGNKIIQTNGRGTRIRVGRPKCRSIAC